MTISGRWTMRRRAVLGVAVMAALGLVVGPATIGQDDPYEIKYVRFEPLAIFGDGQDTTTLRARITGADEVRAEDRSGVFELDGQAVGKDNFFQLFDDGTHGDERAGDQVFTRSGIAARSATDVAHFMRFKVTAQGQEHNTRGPVDGIYYVIDSDERVEITRVDEETQMTPYLVNFRDDGRFFEVADSLDATEAPKTAPIAREFYRYFADEYDFLNIVSTISLRDSRDFHLTVQNDVRGIGLEVMDRASQWGSAGRLLGVNFHGQQLGALYHEIAHQWGVHLERALELEDRNTAHWGTVDFKGYLGGTELADNGDGTFEVLQPRFSNPTRFAPLELYLMGVLPADEVPAVKVLRGVDDRTLSVGDVVEPESVRVVTMADIIDIHGSRRPSAADIETPKTFRVGTVLLTPGRMASAAEMTYYSSILRHASSRSAIDPSLERLFFGQPSFHTATGGHAELVTTLGDVNDDPTADSDGDGVPDDEDLCPNFPGSPEADGC